MFICYCFCLSEPEEAPTGVSSTVMNSTIRVRWNKAQKVRGRLLGYKVPPLRWCSAGHSQTAQVNSELSPESTEPGTGARWGSVLISAFLWPEGFMLGAHLLHLNLKLKLTQAEWFPGRQLYEALHSAPSSAAADAESCRR